MILPWKHKRWTKEEMEAAVRKDPKGRVFWKSLVDGEGLQVKPLPPNS